MSVLKGLQTTRDNLWPLSSLNGSELLLCGQDQSGMNQWDPPAVFHSGGAELNTVRDQ